MADFGHVAGPRFLCGLRSMLRALKNICLGCDETMIVATSACPPLDFLRGETPYADGEEIWAQYNGFEHVLTSPTFPDPVKRRANEMVTSDFRQLVLGLREIRGFTPQTRLCSIHIRCRTRGSAVCMDGDVTENPEQCNLLTQ
jgi:hypothetical protein